MIDKLSYNGIEVSFEQTSREICEKWLSALPDFQRNLKPEFVKMAVRDMTNDRWLFTGDAIRFDCNGSLIDGQHRIKGFLEAGFFPIVLVVRGLDVRCYPLIDGGTPRTYADAFKYDEIANYTTKSSVAKMWMSYSDGKNLGNRRFSKTEVLDAYYHHYHSIEWAIERWNVLEGLVSKTRKTFFASLALERIGQHETESFFNGVETGIGSPAAVAFRKLLIRESNKTRGKFSQHEMAALGIKALKAHAENRPTTLLKWAFDESFPTLEQL
jgi:hypothetical protein